MFNCRQRSSAFEYPVSATNRVNHSIGISSECRSANRIDNLHDMDNIGRIGSFMPILSTPYCCKSDPAQHYTIGARYAKFRTSASTRPMRPHGGYPADKGLIEEIERAMREADCADRSRR
jgi:hypothetical protein